MRLRFLIPLLAAAALAPQTASAQLAAVFDSIVPQSGACTCISAEGVQSAPDWGCLLIYVQNAINVGVGLAIVFIMLAIMYAGFMLVTRGASPTARRQARNVVLNAVIGLVVILGAWLAIDFVMKIVYDEEAVISGRTQLGPWNAIWSAQGDDMCIVVKAPVPITTGTLDILLGPPTSGVPLGVSGALCPESNPGCSVAALRAAGLTEPQARAMSCIAMTESGGDTNSVNRSSRACGLFQITNATARGNWRQPQHHGPGCSVNTPCTNARCNMQTAVIMFRASGYQPWTCRGCNAKAQACINRYDPGH